MTERRRKFSAEFREEAVKMVIDPPRPIIQVARELGLNEGTLGNWVNAWKKAHASDEEAALSVPERARLRELERNNRDLRMENDFLKKAAAFFASKQP
jgi:transposase